MKRNHSAHFHRQAMFPLSTGMFRTDTALVNLMKMSQYCSTVTSWNWFIHMSSCSRSSELKTTCFTFDLQNSIDSRTPSGWVMCDSSRAEQEHRWMCRSIRSSAKLASRTASPGGRWLTPCSGSVICYSEVQPRWLLKQGGSCQGLQSAFLPSWTSWPPGEPPAPPVTHPASRSWAETGVEEEPGVNTDPESTEGKPLMTASWSVTERRQGGSLVAADNFLNHQKLLLLL